MTNVCSNFFLTNGHPSFGGAYIGCSLTKSHNLNVYECAQRWGTTFFQTPTPKNQHPTHFFTKSLYVLVVSLFKHQRVGTKVSTSHMFSFFVSIFFSFFKLNPKSQTNMNEHRHKILVTLVFVWPHPKDKKIETLPSFTKKQKNSEKGKKNEKMTKKHIRFDLGVIVILQ